MQFSEKEGQDSTFTSIFDKCLEKMDVKNVDKAVDKSNKTDEEDLKPDEKAKNAIATQIVDPDLSALDTLDLKNGEDEKEPKLKLASFADYSGANCQSETIHKAYSCAQCGHDMGVSEN